MKNLTNERKTIIVLGGGSGGLVAASKLRGKTAKNTRIILIDKGKTHIFAASFIYLMLGKRQVDKVQKELSLLERKGIEFINDEIVKIDPENKKVRTKKGDFHYDYLIVSLGAELAPEKVPGLASGGFNLYELQDIEKLRDNLKNFRGGKVAVVISSLPFKCPAAPYEAVFLLDEYFQKKGIRDKTEISIHTPETLPMPAAGPEIGKAIRSMVEARNIIFNPEVNLSSVDTDKKELSFEDCKTENFDLLIYVPPHQGPKAIIDSGLGNKMGWIPVNSRTLKTRYDDVYAIGDGVTISLPSGKPLPKAGVFAHFEAEVVAENIASEIKGLPARKKYEGNAYCFLEMGFGRAGFAGGNFYAEPIPVVKMKKPGRLWHWGKLLFEKYWFWKWF